MSRRVGVLGGGQLGRMLALAGYPLGVEFTVIEPTSEPPMGKMATHLRYEYNDITALEILAFSVDVATFEFENVDMETVAFLKNKIPVYPPPAALRVAQERLTEKQYLSDLGIPVPDFYPIDSPDDAHNAVIATGLPAILKTRRMGYDGKGQIEVNSIEEIVAAFERFNRVPLLLEEKVNFRREVSIVAVRNKSGQIVSYPLTENFHQHGILLRSKAPAPDVSQEQRLLAESYAARLMESLEYVGVLTIEFFDVGGKLVANEFAPRVHNSGHWTIEGAVTSQFENHIRAILDLPLGSTKQKTFAGMLNIIGKLPDSTTLLQMEGVHLHLYDKEERPSRKIGHITVCGETEEEVKEKLARIAELAPPEYST